MYVTHSPDSQCVFKLSKFKSVKKKTAWGVFFFPSTLSQLPLKFVGVYSWKRYMSEKSVWSQHDGIKRTSCLLETRGVRERFPGDAGKVSHTVGRVVWWMRFNYAARSKQVATPQVVSITQRQLEERASVSCLAASAICSGAVWIWLCSHS